VGSVHGELCGYCIAVMMAIISTQGLATCTKSPKDGNKTARESPTVDRRHTLQAALIPNVACC
jgi:hypothetical protein